MDEIIKNINALRISLIERNTKQGISVCDSVLSMLKNEESLSSQYEILAKFNRAFIGIEAHGYLTDHEYDIVNHLRRLQLSYDVNS